MGSNGFLPSFGRLWLPTTGDTTPGTPRPTDGTGVGPRFHVLPVAADCSLPRAPSLPEETGVGSRLHCSSAPRPPEETGVSPWFTDMAVGSTYPSTRVEGKGIKEPRQGCIAGDQARPPPSPASRLVGGSRRAGEVPAGMCSRGLPLSAVVLSRARA